MARARPTTSIAIGVEFSAEELRLLERRARDAGQTTAAYVHKQVVAEVGCEEDVLRLLVEEMARIKEAGKRAIARDRQRAQMPIESLEAQKARILKEVRQSLSPNELDAMIRFFKPAFDAGL